MSQAWHLKNTGQAAYSSRGGIAGFDLNMGDLLSSGVNGDAIRVLVLDDGLDIRHPDLKDRIAQDMLWNFDPVGGNQPDPTPPGMDSHGTAVAGIIAATANNNIGSRGIAPNVRLGGARYICMEDECVDPIATLDAYGGLPFSRHAYVINGSYGYSGTSHDEFDPDLDYRALAIRRMSTLRDGKGIVFVKAGGNDFSSNAGDYDADCSSAIGNGVTCLNANLDPESTMPQILVVGAVNADGVKSSYSSAGSNLLVSGLGGEYGVSDPKGYRSMPTGPALITTDLSGCSRGTSQWGVPTRNDLENPTTVGKTHNANCDYMATMNGTSAAAPTVAGVVALMLQANPQLTWRDVRYLLATTARRVDANRIARTVELPSGESYVPEPAWIRNGAGLWFDNWYGFGLVDASAVVAAAKSYKSFLKGHMTAEEAEVIGEGCDTSSAVPVCGTEIPVGDAVDAAFFVSADTVKTIESVQVSLIVDDANLGDLAVELVSPAGTRSVLSNPYSSLNNTGERVEGFVLASQAFLGEPASGTWTLRFVDVARRDNPEPSRFIAAKVAFLGH